MWDVRLIFFCLLLVIFLKNHGLEDLYELFLYPYLANVIIFNPFLTGGSENDPATLVIMIMILCTRQSKRTRLASIYPYIISMPLLCR